MYGYADRPPNFRPERAVERNLVTLRTRGGAYHIPEGLEKRELPGRRTPSSFENQTTKQRNPGAFAAVHRLAIAAIGSARVGADRPTARGDGSRGLWFAADGG